MKNERTPRQLRDGQLKGIATHERIEIAFNIAAVLLGFSVGVFIGVLL